MYPESNHSWCDAPRSFWEKLAAKPRRGSLLYKKASVAWLALSVFAASVTGADLRQERSPDRPVRVLMVGNSFSKSNMRHLPQVAKAMGVRLDVCSLFIPGCTLEMHWHNAEKESPDESKPYICTRNVCGEAQPKRLVDLTEALAMDRWDVVTIQQGSHLSWCPESYRPWGDKLVAKIRELAPCAQIYFQETWSYTPWDRRLKEWGFGQDEMYERIHKAVAGFAGAYGFEVIPMGTAVQRFRRALPVRYSERSFGGDVCGGDMLPPDRQFEIGSDGKWRPASGTKDPETKKMLGRCDVFHLNDDGCYLQALVWAAKLFNVDVRNCPYVPKGLDPVRAELLKRVAFETVSAAFCCREPLLDIESDSQAQRRDGLSFAWWYGSAGARPVTAPRAVCVEMDWATNGFAVLTLKENKRRSPVTFSFTSRWERVMRFATELPDGFECQFDRLRFFPDRPLRCFDGKLLSVVGEFERTLAAACKVDVDTGTGQWLRILHDGDAAPALTFCNTSDTSLSWKGESILEDAFGRQVKVPFNIRAAAGETVRVPLPWPLPARGWWRVTTTVVGADGSKAVSEASLAWLDRHGVTPPLADGKFRMGLHWHNRCLTERQIGRTLDAVVACGAKIVRTGGCDRRYIERQDGTCDWSASDRFVRAVRSRGLAMNAVVWSNPDWAAPTNLSLVCKEPAHPLIKGNESWLLAVCIPPDLKRCEDFYAKLAEHYGDDIAYYEIGNEWDLYNFYPGTTEDGIEILKTCYRGIKRGNPKCIVTPCGWALPDAGGRDHRLAARFVNYGIQDRVLTEAKGFYDVHAVHMHSWFADFRERVLGKFLPNRRRLGVTVPWFANETAVSCVNGNEVTAAKDVWKKIVFAWANGSRDFIWYNLRATGWEKTDSEQGYGIITPDFKPRPAYAAFSALTAVLGGLDFDSTLCSEKEGMELCRFKDAPGGGLVLAGWHNVRTYEGTCRIETDAKKAVLVDMMGNRQELVAEGGIVSWPISHFPSALVLDGSTRAELAEKDVANASLPCVVLADNASTNRPPDLVANRADQVECPYDANPATTDRTWKGVDDCSFKAWLSKGKDGLRLVVEVKDDAIVCAGEREAGDSLKVVARLGDERREKKFPAVDGRRAGDLLVYDIVLPGPCPDAIAVRVDDDDGAGFDLSIGTGDVRIVR